MNPTKKPTTMNSLLNEQSIQMGTFIWVILAFILGYFAWPNLKRQMIRYDVVNVGKAIFNQGVGGERGTNSGGCSSSSTADAVVRSVCFGFPSGNKFMNAT